MMLKEHAFLFLSPDNDGGGDKPPAETPPPDGGGDNIPDDAPDWAKKRLSEISQKKNEALARAEAAEAKLKEQQDALEQARLKKLQEDGELAKVNEALTQKVAELTPKAEQYDALEQGIRSEALNKIADALGEDAAKPYADFDTKTLQTVASTIVKPAAPAPDDSKPGGREVDANEQAALKKYGSKANIARLNPDLYRKLWPNKHRRNG